jgi:hypothetical protein
MLDLKTRDFYRSSLSALTQAGVPVLVGGAYALRYHTGVARETKDLDLLILPRDKDRAFAVMEQHGYKTELTFSHWLGKVYDGSDFIDIIFNSGNGIAPVDDMYFKDAPTGSLFEVDVSWCPAEEMILSKCFVMERERYDGADVAHLLLAVGEKLDWQRLLMRFGDHWRILFAHIVLFGFIYPAERTRIPSWVVQELTQRLKEDQEAPEKDRVCRGTLLSREQFLVDIEDWGFNDARLSTGAMTKRQIASWTDAIEDRPAKAQ